MPDAKAKVTDQEFIFLAMRLSGQLHNINFDFQKVGDALGITKHSAYCRWNKIKKEIEAGLGPTGDTNAAESSTPKRKRATPKKKKDSPAVSDDDDGNEEQLKTPIKKGKTGHEKAELVKQEDMLDLEDLC